MFQYAFYICWRHRSTIPCPFPDHPASHSCAQFQRPSLRGSQTDRLGSSTITAIATRKAAMKGKSGTKYPHHPKPRRVHGYVESRDPRGGVTNPVSVAIANTTPKMNRIDAEARGDRQEGPARRRSARRRRRGTYPARRPRGKPERGKLTGPRAAPAMPLASASGTLW